MRSEKISFGLLVLSAVLLFTACNEQKHSADTAELKKMSDAVTEKMQDIASDENYQTLTGTPDEVKKILTEWSEHPPDTSADILVIPVTEKLIPSYETPDFNLDSLSDSSREYVIRHIVAAFNSRMNSTYGGTAAMAAGSISRYSETFRINTDTFNNQVWLIPCTDSVGITVEFIATGDNVVTVCTSYCALPEPESRDQLLPLIFGASSLEEIGAYYY